MKLIDDIIAMLSLEKVKGLHLVPSYISDNCQSNAEIKLFKSFQELSIKSKAYLFHSVNLPKHQYKQWGEIDFLLVSTMGILVFEVKGGRISRSDGVWKYTDRYGDVHNSNEGPNDQAKSAMFSLKKQLAKEFPRIDFAKIPFGWAMVFPDINYAARSLELPIEMVCDYDSMKGSHFESFINNAYKYFKNKLHQPKELKEADVVNISNFIRPNIDLVPKLQNTIDETNQKLVKGTQQQYAYLNMALENKRILCTGGAGTGKTVLAIEIARSNPDKRILITCKSEVLARFIKGQITNELTDVMSFHQILNNPAFFSENNHMKTSIDDMYDMVVIDEGQDLLTSLFVDFVDKVLKGGYEHGCWRWFMDSNNQAGVDSSQNIVNLYKNIDKINQNSHIDLQLHKAESDEAEEIYQFLEATHPSKINLSHNCRNTEEIILETQLNTGADIGSAIIKGRGKVPHWERINSSSETTGKLEDVLSKLSGDVEYLNDIVILSPFDYSSSSAYHLSGEWQDKLQILSTDNVLNQSQNKILFSDIATFKGLDKHVVLVIDMERTMDLLKKSRGEDADIIKKDVCSFLYVAMTRSNSLLWATLDSKFEKFLDEQRKINLELMRMN